MLGANWDNRYLYSIRLINCRLAPNIGLEERGFNVSQVSRFQNLETLKRETLKPAPKPAQAGQSVNADEDDV